MSDIKVTSCTKAKEVNGKPIYKVTLSDGRAGESFAVEIPQGTPAEDISIEETQYGLKFKLNKKNGYGGGAPRQKTGNEVFALSYAKDWCVAQLEKDQPVKTETIIKVADVFYSWLESKKKS